MVIDMNKKNKIALVCAIGMKTLIFSLPWILCFDVTFNLANKFFSRRFKYEYVPIQVSRFINKFDNSSVYDDLYCSKVNIIDNNMNETITIDEEKINQLYTYSKENLLDKKYETKNKKPVELKGNLLSLKCSFIDNKNYFYFNFFEINITKSIISVDLSIEYDAGIKSLFGDHNSVFYNFTYAIRDNNLTDINNIIEYSLF